MLPTILEYKEKNGVYPKGLTLSLAYLIYFYKNDSPEESADTVTKIKNCDIEEILKDASLWQSDISDMTELVMEYYSKISSIGAKETMKWILSE